MKKCDCQIVTDWSLRRVKNKPAFCKGCGRGLIIKCSKQIRFCGKCGRPIRKFGLACPANFFVRDFLDVFRGRFHTEYEFDEFSEVGMENLIKEAKKGLKVDLSNFIVS